MKEIIRRALDSDFSVVDQFTNELVDLIKQEKYLTNKRKLFQLNFALREVLNNAVEHGNKFQKDKRIHVVVSHLEDEIIIRVEDEGEGIKPLSYDNADVFRDRTRGLEVLEKIARQVYIEHTSITMHFDIEKGDGFMNYEVTADKLEVAFKTDLIAPNVKDFEASMEQMIPLIEEVSEARIKLDEVENIDSIGITFLINLSKRLDYENVDFTISGASDEIIKLFELMKLDEIFTIVR